MPALQATGAGGGQVKPRAPGVDEVPLVACALALRDGCKELLRGVDPCRVCAACQRNGNPANVPYSVVVGRDCTMQEIVVANAHLVDYITEHVPPPPKPKREEPPDEPQPVPVGKFTCGHPRYAWGGFCGPCNPPSLS